MLRVGLVEWVSFSYVNVAERAPVALREKQNRTLCGLTKPPLSEAPWNAELAAWEEGKHFCFRSIRPWGKRSLRPISLLNLLPTFRLGID